MLTLSERDAGRLGSDIHSFIAHSYDLFIGGIGKRPAAFFVSLLCVSFLPYVAVLTGAMHLCRMLLIILLFLYSAVYAMPCSTVTVCSVIAVVRRHSAVSAKGN